MGLSKADREGSIASRIGLVLKGTSGSLRREMWMQIILIAFTIFGLACKFLIEMREPLNSDNIAPGLLSMEIWKHKNYLLTSYYLDSNHPIIFPDLIPLNFLPQVLSSFDPDWIRYVNFILYLGSVAVLALVASRASGDLKCGLAASALLANMYPSSFSFYSLLTMHSTALIAAGLLMLNIKKLAQMRTWKLIVVGVIINALVFSDTIIIAWFIIPYVAVSLLLRYDLRSRAYAALLAISCFITYYWKTNLIVDFLTAMPALRSIWSMISESLPMLIKSMAYLLNGSLYTLFSDPTILDWAIALAFILATAYSIRSAIVDRRPESREIFAILAVSASVILAGYILTSISVNFMTGRYLTMTAASVYVLMAAALRRSYIPYIIVLMLLLSAGAYANYSFLKEASGQPNQDTRELIDLLSSRGLSYGYGDYWDANLVTYLTNEKIVMRPASIYEGELLPFRWVTCERWYSEGPEKVDRYFIVTRNSTQEKENPWNTDLLLKRDDLGPVLSLNEPIETIELRDHTVYVFKGPIPYQQMNGWYANENWSSSNLRWISGDARLVIHSEENKSEVLRFKATSFLKPRTLAIELEGSKPTKIQVTSGTSSIEAPLNLTRGANVIRLHVIEGCDKPCETLGPRNGDCRCISMAVGNITAV